MTEKMVFLKNNSGERIVGVFNLPKGKPPFPTVIICHGFKGYKEQMHLKSLAGQLAKNGILAFRFDFGNGVGKSYGQLEDITFTQYLADLRVVVDFIYKNKLTDKNRIGLAGHSLGGQLIMHYAPTDKRIKVLADLAGVVNRGVGKTNIEREIKSQFELAKKTGYFYIVSKRTGKKYRIKYRYYLDIIKYNTPAQIKKIIIPMLIIHGLKDETVHLSHSRDAYKFTQGLKKLAFIKGVPHTWKQPKYYKKINPIIVSWFKKYLPR